MVIARPKVAIGAKLVALAPHHHRHFGVGFPIGETVDHLNPGALQLGRPFEVLFLIKARFEFHHSGDGHSVLRRFDQSVNDGRLRPCAVERLLDRNDIGIDGGLPNKVHHHFKAFVRVMDHNVLLTDCGEDIAIVFADTFGIAGGVCVELEIGAVFRNALGQTINTDHAVGLDHGGLVHVQLIEQHGFGLRIKVLFKLKLDHLAATPPLDRAAEGAHQIFGLFLDLDIAVAQNAEQAIAFNLEAGEKLFRVTLDQAGD